MAETRAPVKERPAYAFKAKAGAFLRGMKRLRPWRNIAEEGLRGYRLTPKQEEKYVDRLSFTIDTKGISRAFQPWLTEKHQRCLAQALLDEMEIHRDGFRNSGGEETYAKSLFRIRGHVADALAEGRVGSETAQRRLLKAFSNGWADIFFSGKSNLREQARRVVDSNPHLKPELIAVLSSRKNNGQESTNFSHTSGEPIYH